MIVDGIQFSEYEVEAVKLDLRTCKLRVDVVFHKNNRSVVRRKKFNVETDCNVDINEVIKNLKLDESIC